MTDRVVFFDLETGGLDPARHPVIQFAGIAVQGWETVAEMEVKIHFDPSKADPEALRKNSFDPETWKVGAFPSHEAVRKIGDFLREHATLKKISKRGNPWTACQLAAYNGMTFDWPFLRKLFTDHAAFCAGWPQTLDVYALVMWWATTAGEDRPEDLRLESVAPFLGVEHGQAHDALADVRATIGVARVLMEGAWR